MNILGSKIVKKDLTYVNVYMKDVYYIVNIGKHQLDSLWIETISCILKKSLKNIVRIYMYFWSDRKGLMCQMYTSRYNKYLLQPLVYGETGTSSFPVQSAIL